MGAKCWLEISWLFFRKVINVAKKIKNNFKIACVQTSPPSLRKNRLFSRFFTEGGTSVHRLFKKCKKMKNCRKVAEQLVAKPIAKLCLADKALSFKWRYDRCGCQSNLSNCKLSSPLLPKNNNNNNNGFSTRFKHMNSRSVLSLNYSTNWERRPIQLQQANLRPRRSPRLSVPQFSKGKAMRTKLASLLSSS